MFERLFHCYTVLHMDHIELYGSLLGSRKSVASVMDRTADKVRAVGGTEPGHARRHDPAPDAATPGDEWPGEPDEAWLDDPDAHYEEVVAYMERVYACCESSDQFVAALKGLFPDLAEKVARSRALATEDLGDVSVPDPVADLAAGRSVTYLSGAELCASSIARTSDPVARD